MPSEVSSEPRNRETLRSRVAERLFWPNEEGSIRRAPPHEARTRHTAIAAGHAG
jgi:hypothetical protein